MKITISTQISGENVLTLRVHADRHDPRAEPPTEAARQIARTMASHVLAAAMTPLAFEVGIDACTPNVSLDGTVRISCGKPTVALRLRAMFADRAVAPLVEATVRSMRIVIV